MSDRPSHNLPAIQAALALHLRWTGAARAGADAVGFGVADVKATIAAMAPTMFYKTMASEKTPWPNARRLPRAEPGRAAVRQVH